MKRTIIISVLLLALLTPLAAQSGPLALDIGGGVSFAYIDAGTLGVDSEFSDTASLFLMIASLRGGVNGSVRFRATESLSVGAETGLYAMTTENPDTGEKYTFLDIPIRGIVRLGKGDTYLQGFGGYYLCTDVPLFGGVEAGVKVSLGGLYILGAYTINEEISFPRFEVGYSRNNLFGM